MEKKGKKEREKKEKEKEKNIKEGTRSLRAWWPKVMLYVVVVIVVVVLIIHTYRGIKPSSTVYGEVFLRCKML